MLWVLVHRIIFAPIWTVLYALLGVASYQVHPLTYPSMACAGTMLMHLSVPSPHSMERTSVLPCGIITKV